MKYEEYEETVFTAVTRPLTAAPVKSIKIKGDHVNTEHTYKRTPLRVSVWLKLCL